ncbi:MAG: hypothetical protein GTN86_13370 [Xanthomonadales bacterium]|nr:hypothetical protein [Xanthomonadales bacterium]NIN60715.1 hypothetical protein [Xanthomonadales bacterium]NIN76077.1 hypothetical protein [Xanthomonadales bacterium]NIO13688.1 hypothetical protein [Xanthomonadales bacterium]NIP13108.1 hypothetical protein [Xanthomonadales bacterium]
MAYETDQFNNRAQPIADATEAFNQRVNDTIDAAIADWRGPRNDMKVVNRIYHSIGGHHWVDKLERWAMNSPEIERLDTARRESIYAGHPIWATRVAAVFGVGPTVKINGVLVGSDKLGHFLSQGRKFYRRYLRYEDEARAAERSAYTERALFGQMATGSYSNADLVANYEGYRFYRSLFEGGVVNQKPAILQWTGDGWVRQRDFDWADHVNAYWDEALNVNHYDDLLYPHMKTRLESFCPQYLDDPTAWEITGEQELIDRYHHLQLRETSELRLPRLCEDARGGGLVTAASAQP